MPDVMDTLYELESDAGKGFTVTTPILNIYDSPELADLEGNRELSFDIQPFLSQPLQDKENPVGSSESQLFTELLPIQTTPNTSAVADIVTSDQSIYDSVIQDIGSSMPHIVLDTDQSGQTFLYLNEEGSDFKQEPEEESQSVTSDFSVPPSPASSTVSSRRQSYKSKAPSKKRQLEKGSAEYTIKRERNNIAVRKSRDKAKQRQKETEERVKALTAQNTTLQKKLDLLTKELNVLKGLFAKVGENLPKEYKQYIAKTVNQS